MERALEALLKRADDALAAAPPAPAATDAIAKLLGTMMSTNVDLVGAMGDLAVRSVARRNGIRGGQRNAQSAERSRDGKFLPKYRRIERGRPSCALCKDPMTREVTIQMIQEHRLHEQQQRSGEDERESDRADAEPSNGNGLPPVQ